MGVQSQLVHISFDAVVRKIEDKSGLSRADIDRRIADKLEEFSGLISKEGAAHIVANELQISITDLANGPFKISELKLGMRNITVTGKIIAKYPVNTFAKNGREGRVASIQIADKTGSVRVTFWHDDVLVHERLQENDIVSLSNLTAKENRSVLELTASSQTKATRNPAGVDTEALALIPGRKTFVADNSTAYSAPGRSDSNSGNARESTPMPASMPRTETARKSIEQISVTDPAVEIVGVIVQVFKPASFTVDKTTGKKVRLEAGMPADQLHHEQRYVMNIVIDDGTETVRCVFFGNECQQLIGSSVAPAMLKENEYEFSKFKTRLLGQIIRLTAKVVKNQLYDRIELITRSFELGPDPSRELLLVENSRPAGSQTTSGPR